MNAPAIKPLEPDPSFEVSLRPPMFSEFTGQVKVCERLAVLVEAAVRNYILQLRGVDSMAEFMLRQKQEMEESQPPGEAKSRQR
jgi:serine kinase of HPr protein (carbohydrate metabolism regulator)